MVISEQIRKYRTEMGLSQEELGEIIYVTRQTVSNWEIGKSCPDLHSLLTLCTLFHTSLYQMIFDQELDRDIMYMIDIATDELSRVDLSEPHVQAIVVMTEHGRFCSTVFSYRFTDDSDEIMESEFISKFCDDPVVKKIVCVWKTDGRGVCLDLPSHSFRTKLCELDERNGSAEIAMWKSGIIGTRTVGEDIILTVREEIS